MAIIDVNGRCTEAERGLCRDGSARGSPLRKSDSTRIQSQCPSNAHTANGVLGFSDVVACFALRFLETGSVGMRVGEIRLRGFPVGGVDAIEQLSFFLTCCSGEPSNAGLILRG